MNQTTLNPAPQPNQPPSQKRLAAFFTPARIRAFLIHLGISVIIGLISLAIVFFVWYPAPLEKAIGVTHIFLLMLAIDAILGPLLTLVVYKTDKKKLLLDISIIIFCQIGAYAYGMVTVAAGRPAWLVFEISRFTVIRPIDISSFPAGTAEQYRRFPLSGPEWVAAVSPKDKAGLGEIAVSALSGGADLPQRTDLYAPLEEERALIIANRSPLDELLEYNAADAVEKVKQAWPQARFWYPLRTTNISMVVLLAEDSITPLAIVDLNPWPI